MDSCLILAACCLAFSGCQDSAGAQNTIAPAQLSQQEQEILTLATGTNAAVYDLPVKEPPSFRWPPTVWKGPSGKSRRIPPFWDSLTRRTPSSMAGC